MSAPRCGVRFTVLGFQEVSRQAGRTAGDVAPEGGRVRSQRQPAPQGHKAAARAPGSHVPRGGPFEGSSSAG